LETSELNESSVIEVRKEDRKYGYSLWLAIFSDVQSRRMLVEEAS